MAGYFEQGEKSGDFSHTRNDRYGVQCLPELDLRLLDLTASFFYRVVSHMRVLDLEIYAGCWVAIVRGRVVASGATAQETLLNCRSMRLKDEPVLRFIPLPKLK